MVGMALSGFVKFSTFRRNLENNHTVLKIHRDDVHDMYFENNFLRRGKNVTLMGEV